MDYQVAGLSGFDYEAFYREAGKQMDEIVIFLRGFTSEALLPLLLNLMFTTPDQRTGEL